MPIERRMSQCPPSRVGRFLGNKRWYRSQCADACGGGGDGGGCRVSRVSCGHAIPTFRRGGNIIEHYVYRFVTVGRACLVSNSAIPLLFLCPFLPRYTQCTLALTRIRISVKKIIIQIFFRVFITRKLLEICRRSFRFELPRAIPVPFRRTKRCIPTKARLRGARPQRAW